MGGTRWISCALGLLVGCPAPDAPPPVEGVVIRSGPFTMGSPEGEPCREPDEPNTLVKNLGHALRVDAHEVTRDGFRAAMGYDPSFFVGDCPTCPVESVTMHEAMAYCAARAQAHGRRPCYRCEGTGAETRCRPAVDNTTSCDDRLPTPNEWLRVVQATGAAVTVEQCMSREPRLDPVAWYKVNGGGRPHPVGNLVGNGGVYDLWGNVYEWTTPFAVPEAWGRVQGGSWYHNAHHARRSHALEVPTTQRLSYVGFRCVRSEGAP